MDPLEPTCPTCSLFCPSLPLQDYQLQGWYSSLVYIIIVPFGTLYPRCTLAYILFQESFYLGESIFPNEKKLKNMTKRQQH